MGPERKHEWAVNLSAKLKKWLPAHGYQTSTQLADDLGIPKKTWGHIVYGGTIVERGPDGKNDGKLVYARIHLWTELPEADPRNIPDRQIPLPRGGVFPKTRALSELDYQKWLESSEAQTLLAKRNARFKREVIMEQTGPTEPKETVGLFLGTLVDGLINRGTEQVTDSLSRQLSEELKPQIAAVGDKIDTLAAVVIARLAEGRTATNNIGSLTSRLRGLLDRYTSGTREERDNLMQSHGTELLALDIVVHTLTRRPEERESLLRLNKETKL